MQFMYLLKKYIFRPKESINRFRCINMQKMQIKMKKPKKAKQKQDKMQAFMSFLEAPTMSDSIILDSQRKNASDNQDCNAIFTFIDEQFVEDTNHCYICKQNLDPVKKKKCGFCNMETCNNHLRKRRRLNKKFQRICDNCQDKQLFDNYMKLEIKAEQALATQQQIIGMKHNQFISQVEKKRQKRSQLIFKAQSIKSKNEQQFQKTKQRQEEILYKERFLQKQQLEIKQLELFVERLSTSMKQNFEQDHKILLIENDKLGKDLANLDKRRQQINKAIEKRQKQIEAAYQQWEKKQYIKSLEREAQQAAANKKKDCTIY